MTNTKANLKFAIEGLRKLEAKRFEIKGISAKGRGVFLRKGASVTKETFLMQYSGRITDAAPVPENQYTFEIKQRHPANCLWVDASKKSYCTGMLIRGDFM